MIIFLSLEGVYTDCSKVGGSCQGFFLGGGRSPRSMACPCLYLLCLLCGSACYWGASIEAGKHALKLISQCVFSCKGLERGNVNRLCRDWFLFVFDYVPIIAKRNAFVKNFFHQ